MAKLRLSKSIGCRQRSRRRPAARSAPHTADANMYRAKAAGAGRTGSVRETANTID
jgi:GGDEF domain-containing protein